MLDQAINDYLSWIKKKGFAQSTQVRHARMLKHFLPFVTRRKIPWNEMFTPTTIENCRKESGMVHISPALRGLSRYLYLVKKIITQPLGRQNYQLPSICEEYLIYFEKGQQSHTQKALNSKRVLTRILSQFADYLKIEKKSFSNMKLEHVDGFLKERSVHLTAMSLKQERFYIRHFLRYLYYERGILRRDLSSLLTGAPIFAHANPPRFLRPDEVRRLFAALKSSSAKELRVNAMIHLAYFLGLRPIEISLVSLDDIHFSQSEITLPCRKAMNPIKLPLPENTLKIITAYIVGGRPKSNDRSLFIELQVPYESLSAASVSGEISECMRMAGLRSSAYWLRHTYAQNLLESKASIFDIKEMLGHTRIQTTKRYIHIHTKLMREALFDETF